MSPFHAPLLNSVLLSHPRSKISGSATERYYANTLTTIPVSAGHAILPGKSLTVKMLLTWGGDIFLSNKNVISLRNNAYMQYGLQYCNEVHYANSG